MARVLVVDDNADLRKTMRQTLELEGFEVGEAADGAQAMAEQQARPSDVLITDILMPNRHGVDAISDFNKHYPDVAIIAISGSHKVLESDIFLTALREAGARRFLSKPFRADELIGAVRAVLQTP